jgi:hypothetical protein
MQLPTTTVLALAAFLLPAGTSANGVSCTGSLTDPSDIAQCADFLTFLGSQACVSIDIAIAVGRILDSCTEDTGPPQGVRSAGQTDANNNGDIVVIAVAKS